MKFNKVFCFFEQSGTFRNVFRSLGYDSYDVDIRNDFNCTDFVLDIFSDVNNWFLGKPSIFDSISKNDLIFAFFPCIRFTRRMIFNFVRSGTGKYKFSNCERLLNNIKYFDEINFYYSMLCKLCYIVETLDLRMIIENPYSDGSILSQFFFYTPTIIDSNRLLRGDNFIKPTVFYFINCEPSYNVTFQNPTLFNYRTVNSSTKVERSIISSNYSYNFVREFVLD